MQDQSEALHQGENYRNAMGALAQRLAELGPLREPLRVADGADILSITLNTALSSRSMAGTCAGLLPVGRPGLGSGTSG